MAVELLLLQGYMITLLSFFLELLAAAILVTSRLQVSSLFDSQVLRVSHVLVIHGTYHTCVCVHTCMCILLICTYGYGLGVVEEGELIGTVAGSR